MKMTNGIINNAVWTQFQTVTAMHRYIWFSQAALMGPRSLLRSGRMTMPWRMSCWVLPPPCFVGYQLQNLNGGQWRLWRGLGWLLLLVGVEDSGSFGWLMHAAARGYRFLFPLLKPERIDLFWARFESPWLLSASWIAVLLKVLSVSQTTGWTA